METLHEDADQSKDTQVEAKQLAAHLCKFESIFMCLFWADILERVDKVNLILQAEGLCLKAVVDSMKSLLEYFKSIRTNFDHYENKAFLVFSKLFDDVESPIYHCEAKRGRTRKKHFTETDRNDSNEHNFTPRDKFRSQTFLVVCDSLITEISRRSTAYSQVHGNFSFLFYYSNEDLNSIKEAARNLVVKYKGDLEMDLENEIIQFHKHMSLKIDDPYHDNVLTVASNILAVTSQSYPNVAIAVRIYLTLPCSVCEGERSFSKLSHIKNEKRSTMGQNCLNWLSLISIEHELAKKVDLQNIIDKFARAKARKVAL